MKAEHRKELERNALAEGMGRMIRGVKERPSRRSAYIWLGVVLLAAGLGLWYFFSNQSRNNNAETWARLDTATDFTTIIGMAFDISEGQKGEPAPILNNQGKVARFQYAWLVLWEDGIKVLTKSPEEATRNITTAKSLFDTLAEECSDDPVLGPEAYYAIAVAEESLAADPALVERQLNEAKKAYAKVAEKYPNSAYGLQAKKRVDALTTADQRAQIEGFYSRMGREIATTRDMQKLMREFEMMQQKKKK